MVKTHDVRKQRATRRHSPEPPSSRFAQKSLGNLPRHAQNATAKRILALAEARKFIVASDRNLLATARTFLEFRKNPKFGPRSESENFPIWKKSEIFA